MWFFLGLMYMTWVLFNLYQAKWMTVYSNEFKRVILKTNHALLPLPEMNTRQIIRFKSQQFTCERRKRDEASPELTSKHIAYD